MEAWGARGGLGHLMVVHEGGGLLVHDEVEEVDLIGISLALLGAFFPSYRVTNFAKITHSCQK